MTIRREPVSTITRIAHRVVRLCGVLLITSFATPSPATAQAFGALTELFKKVSDLAVHVDLGRLVNTQDLTTSDFLLDAPNGLRGFGFELLIEVVSQVNDSNENDTTKVCEFTGTKIDRSCLQWGVSVGIGYSYMTGFVAREPTLDLRGSILGLPSIAIYVAPPMSCLQTDSCDWVPFPYFGMSIGRLQLHQVTGYPREPMQETVSEFAVSGFTFELGLQTGLSFDIGYGATFIEAAYRVRNLRGIRWGGDIPATWPRSMDVSAVTLSIGFQFPINP